MTVLVLDDVESNLVMISALIAKLGHRRVMAESSPLEALARLDEMAPELILVDYIMPGMDGIAFTKAVRAKTRFAHVPIVMVTASDAREVRMAALDAGVTEFLNKPLDPTEFKVRLRSLFRLVEAHALLSARARWLADTVIKVSLLLAASEDELAERLVRAAERGDAETGGGPSRVARYAGLIAAGLGLAEDARRDLERAAPIFDLGRAGADGAPGGASGLAALAARIAMAHHERWDGSGYPLGLRGAEIPLAARVTALAAMFDALTAAKPHGLAWPVEAAASRIREESGKHFDPACVEAFLARWDEILRTRETLAA